MKYINLFSETTTFVSGMAPFADQNFGPTWFTNSFPGVSPQVDAQSNAVWRVFMPPIMMSFRIETRTKGYGFMNYQPNLVARQFSLSQMLQKSLVSHSSDIVWAGSTIEHRRPCSLPKVPQENSTTWASCIQIPTFLLHHRRLWQVVEYISMSILLQLNVFVETSWCLFRLSWWTIDWQTHSNWSYWGFPNCWRC